MRARALFGAILLSMSVAAPGAGQSEPALRVAEGSVARSQVVALSRDVVIEGQASSEVVALDGSAIVVGRVEGDVIVLGGDVRLEPGGRIEGDVFVVGGAVTAAPGSSIGGRTVAHPSMSDAWVTLLEGPSLGLPATAPLVIGAKLALLSGWVLVALLLFATTGTQVVSTSKGVAEAPFRSFAVGLTAIVGLTLAALFVTTLTGSLVGVPIAFLVVVVLLLLKLWGMVAVFHAFGDWLARSLVRHPLLPLNAATAGLGVLGVVKLLPAIGVWAWTVATVIGVGASLTTKFGRREPWFVG